MRMTMAVLSLCVLAGNVQAQELDQKQKQDLERAKKDVKKAEEAHARDSRSSTFQFHFGNASRRVSGLPQGHPEVKVLADRLAAIDPEKPKPKPGKEEPGKEPPSGTDQGNEPKTESKEKYPAEQVELDIKEMKRIEILFNSYKNFGKDEKVFEAASRFIQTKEYMAPYKWYLERAKHYGPYIPKNKWRSYTALQKTLDRQIMQTSSAIRGLFSQVKQTIKNKLINARSALKNAHKYAKRAVEKRDYSAFQKGWDEKLARAKKNYSELEALVGPDHVNAKELKGEIDKVIADIEEMGRTFKAEVSADRKAKILARLDGFEAMGRNLAEKKQMGLLESLPNKLKRVDEMIEDLVSIVGGDDPSIAEVRKRRAEAKSNVEEMFAGLDQKMAEEARAPKDKYDGSDGGKFRKMISSAWKNTYPNDRVLAVRLYAESWERTVENRWDSVDKKWEKVDKAFLMLVVVVQIDDTYAIIYPAFANRNNLTGELKTGVHTKKGGLYNPKKMLVKNFR